MAASSHLNFVNPPGLAKPPGFSHLVEVIGPGRLVFIAGQVGLDETGKLAGAPGDFRAQAVQAFENLKRALAAVGAGFADVVKLNNYMTDIAAQLRTYLEVRDRYVNREKPPASTTVQVGKLALDSLLYEVEAIAVLPPR